MAKQQINIRLAGESREAGERLQSTWGYESLTDAVEASLVCWEWALTHAGESVAQKFTRAEWNMMADVCNGTMWAYGHTGSSPGHILAAEIADGHSLDGTGYRWLCESDLPDAAERAACDEQVRDLVRRLAGLDYCEAWAVIRAVCWFWQHNDIDWRVDEWWTAAFRRQKAVITREGKL